MPALSPTMETGSIGKWNIFPGSKVKPGNSIASIETDKTAVDFESTDSFILVKALYPEGQSVTVGHVIAIAAEDQEE